MQSLYTALQHRNEVHLQLFICCNTPAIDRRCRVPPQRLGSRQCSDIDPLHPLPAVKSPSPHSDLAVIRRILPPRTGWYRPIWVMGLINCTLT